jgi:hypothetical protein
LLLVPVFGAALEALQRFPDVHEAWPWLALVMWAAAAAIGVTLHWPAERRIQALVSVEGGVKGSRPAGPPPQLPGPLPASARPAGELPGREPDLASSCTRAIWSSAAMALLFVACVAVMVTQPH